MVLQVIATHSAASLTLIIDFSLAFLSADILFTAYSMRQYLQPVQMLCCLQHHPT